MDILPEDESTPEQYWHIIICVLEGLDDPNQRAGVVQVAIQDKGPCPDVWGERLRAALKGPPIK